MDANRQLPDPASHHPPPPRLMASPQTRPIAPYQQPSLPSIRQLHPYLPPSGMAQHMPPSDPSTYTYPLPSPYSGPSGSSEIQQPPSQHALYGRSEMIDSEPEGEIEQQGPAKKKRRRQALSCNECKRRKIKCDRAQPCGPCTRRGEQSKCQWRTLEPVDKYVTRTEYEELKNRSKAEYDELKSRLDHLESVVARLFPPPAGPANVPMYSIPADISGASSSDNVTSYHSAHSSAGQALYVASSSSFTQDPAKSQSYAGSSSPHIAGSGISHGPSIPSSSSNPQSVSQSAGPSHLRHPSDSKSPTINTGRASAPGSKKLERPSGTSLRHPQAMEHVAMSGSAGLTMEGPSMSPGTHHLSSSRRYGDPSVGREGGDNRDRRQGPVER
ncbi:hypothetical protein BDR06DRAFT_964840 [Suillus hirtellus]|nr:hypothetical protein BDR06DRAFT_964840 [Suillus hirtellus]